MPSDLPVGAIPPLDPEDENEPFGTKFFRRAGGLAMPILARKAGDVAAEHFENRYAGEGAGSYLNPAHPAQIAEDRREMTGRESDLRQKFLRSRGLETPEVPLDPAAAKSDLALGLGGADLAGQTALAEARGVPRTTYGMKRDTINWETPLSPEEEKSYRTWATKSGRNFRDDEEDYDLKGFYKDVVRGNPDLPERYAKTVNEWRGHLNPDGTLKRGGHLPDLYKKPNHPTFSNESVYDLFPGGMGGVSDRNMGGQWDEKTKTFTPGPTNMKHWNRSALQHYFDKFEPGYKVKFPDWYK